VAAVSRQPAVGRPARPGSLLLRLPADTGDARPVPSWSPHAPARPVPHAPPADRSKALPCGRPGFDGACARRRPVSRGGRKRSRPTGGLTSGHQAGMVHVKINQVSSWGRWTIRHQLVYQPAGFRQRRIHTDADGGVTGSQSPVQSGAAEGIQA